MFFNMANIQRMIITFLLVLTATFLFLAQSSEAAKGPKITHKVAEVHQSPRDPGLIGYSC